VAACTRKDTLGTKENTDKGDVRPGRSILPFEHKQPTLYSYYIGLKQNGSKIAHSPNPSPHENI
jgi:hypothetical protein